MAYARPAPDRPRGAAVKAYWLEPRNRRRGDREPGLGLTPYSVEQADPDPRPWRDVGIKRGAAISVSGHSGRRLPSRRFLTAIGVDHVLNINRVWPIKTADQVPAKIVQIGIEDGGNLRPFFAVAKNLAVANYSDNLAGLRIGNIALEHVFLFCVSDVTFITPNSARCSGSVLLSADAARWRAHPVRCPLSDALDCLRAVQSARALQCGEACRGARRRQADRADRDPDELPEGAVRERLRSVQGGVRAARSAQALVDRIKHL
jgi:hypothetical protein